jgi:hypothetical protein
MFFCQQHIYMKNILTNPVFIALIAAILTFLFLKWKSPVLIKRRRNGKKVKVKKKVNIMIPIVVGTLAWVGVYGFQEFNKDKDGAGIGSGVGSGSDVKDVVNQGGGGGGSGGSDNNANASNLGENVNAGKSSSEHSFRMMGAGISIPNNISENNLPDVFIKTI